MIDAKQSKWLGLSALMPALAMVFIDQAILPVALPTMRRDLKASHTALWWCINSYLLVSSILLLAGGKLGDRMGHRRCFAWGILIFAISSALCSLSFDVEWLIGARALQGLGAALMIPSSGPLLRSLFPPKERGKAWGINVSAGSVFFVMAPLLGGYIIQSFSWRWIFWINLPVAGIGLLLILLFLSPSTREKQFFDPLSFSFFILSASSLVILIMQSNKWGLVSIPSMSLLFLFLIATCLFFWRETKTPHPFIDRTPFRHPIYKAAVISLSLVPSVLMITAYRTIFLQDAFHWSPLRSGVIICISSLPILFMAPLGGWLSDRMGPKIPIVIGFAGMISSCLWLAWSVQNSLPILLFGFLLFNLGTPLVLTPSFSSAMNVIPPQKSGAAFATLSTVRAFSTALGIAFVSAVTSRVQEKSFQDLIRENPLTNTLDTSLVQDLALGKIQTAASLSAQQQSIVSQALSQSHMESFSVVHLILGLIMILAFAIVFAHHNRPSSHHLPKTPVEGWD